MFSILPQFLSRVRSLSLLSVLSKGFQLPWFSCGRLKSTMFPILLAFFTGCVNPYLLSHQRGKTSYFLGYWCTSEYRPQSRLILSIFCWIDFSMLLLRHAHSSMSSTNCRSSLFFRTSSPCLPTCLQSILCKIVLSSSVAYLGPCTQLFNLGPSLSCSSSCYSSPRPGSSGLYPSGIPISCSAAELSTCVQSCTKSDYFLSRPSCYSGLSVQGMGKSAKVDSSSEYFQQLMGAILGYRINCGAGMGAGVSGSGLSDLRRQLCRLYSGQGSYLCRVLCFIQKGSFSCYTYSLIDLSPVLSCTFRSFCISLMLPCPTPPRPLRLPSLACCSWNHSPISASLASITCLLTMPASTPSSHTSLSYTAYSQGSYSDWLAYREWLQASSWSIRERQVG